MATKTAMSGDHRPEDLDMLGGGDPRGSEAVIVGGFHRSGTSLVCQLLSRAGLFLGDELLGATFSNKMGHYEDVKTLRLHERLLADNGRTWRVGERFLPVINEARWRELREFVARREGQHALWGFKDPRVCLFLPVWKHVLPGAKLLLVYRHFADSTHSLTRRQATEIFSGLGRREDLDHFWREPDLALRMWLVHNEALLDFARSHPEDTFTVSLESVQSGFPLVAAIKRRWGLELGDADVGEIFDGGLTSRSKGRQAVSDTRLIPRVDSVFEELERLSGESARYAEEARVAGR